VKRQEILNKIRKAIGKAQKKGLVYYPADDAELMEEWGKDAINMDDETFDYHVEINSICSGGW